MLYFGNSPKIGFRILEKCFIKKTDIENLIFLFLFHGLSFYHLEKRKTIGVHRANYLSGGQISPTPTGFGDDKI